MQGGGASWGKGLSSTGLPRLVLCIASDIPCDGAKLDRINNITSRQSYLTSSLGKDSF